MKKNLFLIVFVLIFASFCYAQEEINKVAIIKANGGSCELNSLLIDNLTNMFVETDQKLFVIVRKTKNEINYVRQQRLLQIRNLLLEHKGFPEERIIFAEGEDDKKQDKIEFYLGSRLVFVALANKNLRICWDCCVVSYEDYIKLPKKKKILKKKQK